MSNMIRHKLNISFWVASDVLFYDIVDENFTPLLIKYLPYGSSFVFTIAIIFIIRNVLSPETEYIL